MSRARSSFILTFACSLVVHAPPQPQPELDPRVVGSSAAHLPVHLSGCRELLICAGSTYKTCALATPPFPHSERTRDAQSAVTPPSLRTLAPRAAIALATFACLRVPPSLSRRSRVSHAVCSRVLTSGSCAAVAHRDRVCVLAAGCGVCSRSTSGSRWAGATDASTSSRS
jgi:hypothetical protein